MRNNTLNFYIFQTCSICKKYSQTIDIILFTIHSSLISDSYYNSETSDKHYAF